MNIFFVVKRIFVYLFALSIPLFLKAQDNTKIDPIQKQKANQTTITSGKKSLSKKYIEIKRIMQYTVTHPDIPTAFNGLKIVFLSELHYKSLFDSKGLSSLCELLRKLRPDMLLMGGDYQEGCRYIDELFDSIAAIKPPIGIYGVLGNNDYERCTDSIRATMRQYGIHLLEQKCDTININNQHIILAGIYNSTATDNASKTIMSKCPTLSLNPNDFVILLTHTPDYAEEYKITNTDLVLAGHTHGGQILILGHTLKTPSIYGKRFLRGLRHNIAGIPMIITNGIGTSRINIRVGAPSEIILITLHSIQK